MFYHMLEFYRKKSITLLHIALFQFCTQSKSSFFVMVTQLSWNQTCACFKVIELSADNVIYVPYRINKLFPFGKVFHQYRRGLACDSMVSTYPKVTVSQYLPC